ncbi:MAG: hypothetical protein U5K69_15985 [Balneolaceae bacterium]|nr:hypothetical protein [Balneolaceae bacterium]
MEIGIDDVLDKIIYSHHTTTTLSPCAPRWDLSGRSASSIYVRANGTRELQMGFHRRSGWKQAD